MNYLVAKMVFNLIKVHEEEEKKEDEEQNKFIELHNVVNNRLLEGGLTYSVFKTDKKSDKFDLKELANLQLQKLVMIDEKNQ